MGPATTLVFLSIWALCGALCACAQYDKKIWKPVDDVLQGSINGRQVPGLVALVGNEEGILYVNALGRYTYDEPGEPKLPSVDGQSSPTMSPETLFDMASLTKVTATTTAVMWLYQRNYLGLDDPVSKYMGEAYNTAGTGTIPKTSVSIRHLLQHDAGFPPDPIPNYWTDTFGCAATANKPPRLDWSCQDKIYDSMINQFLQREPGVKYVYSDLSMITASYVVGKIVKSQGLVSKQDLIPQCDSGSPGSLTCWYEAFVRIKIITQLGLDSILMFRPVVAYANGSPMSRVEQDRLKRTAPTWISSYQERLMVGFVSDGNAYASGGIAGHAGLFGTVHGISMLVRALLYSNNAPGFISRNTVSLFTKVVNETFSSRALGWDTNAASNTKGYCSDLSPSTFTHTGYTGTQICADPVRNVYTILLTNRCFPNDTHKEYIGPLRKAWNSAVVDVLTNNKDVPVIEKIYPTTNPGEDPPRGSRWMLFTLFVLSGVVFVLASVFYFVRRRLHRHITTDPDKYRSLTAEERESSATTGVSRGDDDIVHNDSVVLEPMSSGNDNDDSDDDNDDNSDDNEVRAHHEIAISSKSDDSDQDST